MLTHFCEEHILTHFCEENIQMRIYIENAHVFFPLLAATGAASIAQLRVFSLQVLAESPKHSSDLNERKICNGKTKGLAIHVQINTLLNLHKETTCFFFPLLAATGAASIFEMRVFSFEFCKK